MKYLFFVVVLLAFLPIDTITAAGLVTCDGVDCSACDFVGMVNIIIKWIFGLVFVLFAGIMAVAGFGLVTSGGNQSALEAAKSKFTNGIIGLIIVMAGWLIVDTIMRGVVGGGSTGVAAGELAGWGPWSQVKCQVQTESIAFVRESSSVIDPLQGTVSAPTAASGGLTQADAEALLLGKPISFVSTGSCTDKSKTNCTSLDGIQPATVNGLISLQSSVGVPLIVTGGTEAGHSDGTYSHSNGYKIDVKPNKALNDYITTNFTQIGPTKYQDSKGNTYYRHPPDHWDITITN